MARNASKSQAGKSARDNGTAKKSADSLADAPVTVPGLSAKEGHEVAQALQMRLHGLNDLQLTLKHAHWNVVGPHFIGVHTMLDPQIAGVRVMVDVLAELVAARDWDDYDVGRADATVHLAALDAVYTGVIEDHRTVIDEVGETDPVTEDILIGQTAELEQYQWFIRAHLQDAGGVITKPGA